LSSNDDDFTDIRSLPDLDEQEDDFESLESMAENLGIKTEHVEETPKEDFNFEEDFEDILYTNEICIYIIIISTLLCTILI